jgi:capsular polysaccharide transport system permease protein
VAAEARFFDALRIQGRVIRALLMWEVVTRYGRDNLGFLWLFLEPMIFTLAVTALWSATGLGHTVHLPIVAFALTGYSSVLLWRNSASRCCLAIPATAGLLYHRPVRVLDILLTKILLEVAGATISFVVLGALWIGIGWAEPPNDVMVVLGAWLLLAWFGGALGLILGALTAFSEIAERLWHPTAYILFPLSGAIFMAEWLAPEFRQFVLWLPMVHGVELLREGYFGSVIRTHYDVQFMIAVCLGMTVLALATVRAAGRKVNFR